MRTFRTLLVAGTAAIAVSGAAWAQDGGNFYIQGFGGVNWVEDMDFSETDGVTPSNGSIDFDAGYGVGGAVGYDFGGWRLEGEVAYRDNDVDSVTSPFVNSASGDVSALTIMANIYADFDTGSAFTPYVGAGVGAGLVDLNLQTVTPFGSATFSDDGWGFAAQGIVGAGYEVADNVELFAEGRVLAIFEPGLSDSNTFGQTAGFTSTGVMDDDYVSYGAFAGLRVHFAPPAPPPAEPMAEPEPMVVQNEFIVFFDWDRSVLTAQANNVLDEVVVVYDANGFAQVNLAGHTDTSGPASYNVGLSERRAESVRQGLVARGVAPDEIVVRFFGETELLVPTPNGVREPQNRRVEIVLM